MAYERVKMELGMHFRPTLQSAICLMAIVSIAHAAPSLREGMTVTEGAKPTAVVVINSIGVKHWFSAPARRGRVTLAWNVGFDTRYLKLIRVGIRTPSGMSTLVKVRVADVWTETGLSAFQYSGHFTLDTKYPKEYYDFIVGPGRVWLDISLRNPSLPDAWNEGERHAKTPGHAKRRNSAAPR